MIISRTISPRECYHRASWSNMIIHPRNFPITTSRTIPRRKSCHRQDCHTQLCFKHHGDSTTFCDDLSNYLAGRMLSQSIMIKHHGNSTTFCDDLSNYLTKIMLSQSIIIKHHGRSTNFLWWPLELSRWEDVVTIFKNQWAQDIIIQRHIYE